MKLHLGCGPIYLKGYVNVDAAYDTLATMAPTAWLEKNTTTFDNYYKHEFGKGGEHVVVDVRATFPPLPFDDESADEVVMMHVLEHFPQYEVGAILDEIFRVLRPSGSFVVGVPHTKLMAKGLAEAKTDEDEDWWLRCLYGTQKNMYSHHYCGHTPRMLRELLSKHGFARFDDMPNINCYPAIRLRAHKERSL